MSLGGFRDPRDPERDAFSPLEAAAVAYAHGKGAVVVAAVGNGDDAPPTPWPFASYPAALPHVLGVSALGRDGARPGLLEPRPDLQRHRRARVGDLSTLPARADGGREGVRGPGLLDLRRRTTTARATGTSFAAPQVSAAAAVLLALRPTLRPEQVTALLTRTARDVNAATGCRACPLRRDPLSGWGRLDVTEALARARRRRAPAARPASSRTTTRARRRSELWGQTKRIEATLDFWDDQNDVYAIKLRRGQPVYLSVRGPTGTDTNLILWKPGHEARRRSRLARAASRSSRPARPARVPLLPRAEERLVLRAGEARLGAAPAATSCDRQGLRRELLVLEQLLVGHVAQHARRVADDERARRHVLRHDRAGADERLLADLDARAEDRAAADARAAADRRALDARRSASRSGP